MKNLQKTTFFLLALLFAIGCSKSDDNNVDPNKKPPVNTVQLEVRASANSVKVGEEVYFTAILNKVEIEGASFYMEGEELNNPYRFAKTGSYKITARKSGYKESNPITVSVTQENDEEPVEEGVLYLKIEDAKTSVEINQPVQFLVYEMIDHEMKEVKDAEIYVNAQKIGGYTFTTDTPGLYKAYAQRGSLKSDEVEFEVYEFIQPVGKGKYVFMGEEIKIDALLFRFVDVIENNGELVAKWSIEGRSYAKNKSAEFQVYTAVTQQGSDYSIDFPVLANIKYGAIALWEVNSTTGKKTLIGQNYENVVADLKITGTSDNGYFLVGTFNGSAGEPGDFVMEYEGEIFYDGPPIGTSAIKSSFTFRGSELNAFRKTENDFTIVGPF